MSLEERVESLEKDIEALKKLMKLREEESLMFLYCIKLIYKHIEKEELKRELGELIEKLDAPKKKP